MDPRDVEAYRRDGVVVLRGVVPAATLAALARGLEANMASPGPWANDYTPPGAPGRFFDDYVNWARIPEYAEAATRGPLPGIALALMGGRAARLFHEHVLVKEAGTREPTPWHHDDPYYGIDGMDNVSLWIPLDPIPVEMALRFIPGSHRWGARYIPRRFADQREYVDAAAGFTHLPPPAELDARGSVSCPVEPGDVVAFHFRALHAAPGTDGHGGRRAVSLRYVGDDARWGTRPWRTSPPLEPHGLRPGDELDDPRFPVVARAS